MKKNVIFSALLLLAVGYGVAVGVKRIFPYNEIQYIIYVISNSDIGHSLYYYYKGSQFKFFKNHNTNRIVMLGDSITDGGDWDELLERNDILNMGIDGDTSSGLLDRIDIINSNVKTAFIMIGINDISREKNADYVFTNYKNIITSLQEKNITPIIQSTLYAGKNHPQKLNEEVSKLNNRLSDYCKINNLVFIDLNKQLSQNNLLRDAYSLDGIHLNGSGYSVWAKTLQSYL